MPSLQFSILIPWSNRDELRFTLRENVHWLQRHDVEILLLNCGGNPGDLRHLILDSGATRVRQLNIPSPCFNKALALNIGIHSSHTHWLFALDADVILRSDILAESMPFLESGSFVTLRWLHESAYLDDTAQITAAAPSDNLNHESFLTSICKTHIVEMQFRDGTSVSIPTYRYGKGKRIGCGQLLVSKKDIAAIGGYNSNIRQWGWEDNDIQVRLKKVRALNHIELGDAVHVSHGDEKRVLDGQSRSQTDLMNFRYVCACYAAGDFAGTYLRDIDEWGQLTTEALF
jgi:hypothetical protein